MIEQPQEDIVISLKDINKTYPGAVPLHVLKDVSLDIRKGELVSIMGASGSGKSTLLNILGILDNYDSGSYILDGVPIKDLSENRAAELRNRMIGFVFQSFNLINYKNALENVALPLFYQGIGRKRETRWRWSNSKEWDSPTAPIICRGNCPEDRNREWR